MGKADPGRKKPKILVVSAECAALPSSMARSCDRPFGDPGGGGAAAAGLVEAMHAQGVEVHLAFPDYCALFRRSAEPACRAEDRRSRAGGEDRAARAAAMGRIHRAQDRIFYYAREAICADPAENRMRALAFQREVIHQVLPRVSPDLVHCIGSATGLVPAAARSMGIQSVFTPDSAEIDPCTLAQMEDCGIDPVDFWRRLYFTRYPEGYENSRTRIPADLAASGVFAADRVHFFSPGFLERITKGAPTATSPGLRPALERRLQSRCVAVVPGACESGAAPSSDRSLARRYTAADHGRGKKINKIELQQRLGLTENAWAPLLLCHAPLGSGEKRLGSLARILARGGRSSPNTLQLIFFHPAGGGRIREIFSGQVESNRWAVCHASDGLLGQGLAAADLFLGLSDRDPTGLLSHRARAYGALPVVPETGGAADCLLPMNDDVQDGNGILYRARDNTDLARALARALAVARLPTEAHRRAVSQLMQQGRAALDPRRKTPELIRLYESVIGRPLRPGGHETPVSAAAAELPRLERA